LRSAEVIQVAKAVRMITGLRAALRLADDGFTTECCTLLRTVSDFAAEILFVGEGIVEGRFTSSQQKFIDQFFVPSPTDPDELAAREREYYVGRKDIIAALSRLAQKARIDSEQLERLVAYLNKGYDSYVHGAYGTAMELFTGQTHTFMLGGHESPQARCDVKIAIAGKLHETLVALELMAMTRRMDNLITKLGTARQRLEESGEQSDNDCPQGR
jgi:hypothetical protein